MIEVSAFDRAAATLNHVDARTSAINDVVKIGRTVLGEAPIIWGATAVTGTLKAALGASNSKTAQVIDHAGLAADGLFRGLLYSGGLLHGAATRKVPWLVTSRAAPKGLAGVASGLSKIANVARLGLLGVGGALGALRGARAVVAADGDVRALWMTRDGRGGTLQAVGSALLMIKHPATYLAGAGVFIAALINDVV